MRRRPSRLLPAALLLLAGCATLQKAVESAVERPRVTFDSASVQALDLEGATLLVRLKVENPNGFGVDVARASYRGELEGHPLAEGSTRTALSVPARATGLLELPVRVRFAEVPDLLADAARRETIGWKVQGSAGLDTPVGVIDVPFSAHGSLPSPRPPGLSLVGLSLKGVSLDAAAVEAKVEVTNPNAFAIPACTLELALELDGKVVVAAAPHQLGGVPARGQVVLTVPLKVPFKGAGDQLGRLLRGGGGEATLSGAAVVGGSRFPFRLSGAIGR